MDEVTAILALRSDEPFDKEKLQQIPLPLVWQALRLKSMKQDGYEDHSMNNINSHLAKHLLLEYYTYRGRQISAVDMFFCDRKRFSELVLQGLIADEEERFLKRYEKELREIYTGYLFPNIRKERLKIFDQIFKDR